ncbi:MAG: M14 family metallopeptidase [Vicinamibacterales bacterium]
MLFALMMTTALAASPAPELAPGATYDPRIPTITKTLGHDHGEVITPPEEVAAYLGALHRAAPDRTRLVEYARSWEGRPLWLFIVGSPERIARLEEVKAGLRRIADPRGLAPADAERLVRELPVVTWLMHGVHGNEISSSDAALAEAYHLLAAQGDADVQAILRESIVVIDPMQNPDGRARFVFQNLLGRAASPDPAPVAAEHDEPWPGGRSNHYLFDMNRDWFAQSQPETKGRIAAMLEWFPHVVVDLHEMGGDSSYYFAPPAVPINPHITKAQMAAFDLFGKANAGKFDERGFAYFIRENYDSFYPGYGESWPIFHGAIGMTYEQASARGLMWRRTDGDVLTFRDGVVRHFTSAIMTAATAAKHRERLVREFLEYRRSAVQEGEKGAVREYVIVPGADRSRALRLARNLATQGIEVRRADEALTIGARTIPAGAFVVSNAQPSGRLIRNLLDPHTAQDDPFVKEQDRRRRLRLGDQIYDITAWSLPLVFDVEVITSPATLAVRSTPVALQPVPATALPPARVGYLLPWGSATAPAVAEMLRSGIRVRHAGLPFTLGGRKYAIGTAIVRTSDNGADLASKLAPIVARHEAEIVPVDSGYQDEGISLGSGNVRAMKAPRVLLAWDAPTQSLSAGFARYVLERRFGQPATAVRVASFARADLDDFDVIVLPSGTYAPLAGDDSLRRLRDWMRGGGTLVTVGEASRWAASVKLLETATELRGGKPDVTEPSGGASSPASGGSGGAGAPGGSPPPFDYDKAIQPERERPENTPGGILRVELDEEHWLASGQDRKLQAIVEGNRVFTPIRLDKGRNVGVYAATEQLVASGLVWDDARDQLARKAFLVHQPLGQGHLIAFAEEPNYRAFAEATELLFINAVLLGPTY